MSIVGTQSVSMQDLMKLGPQALNSMAQGQIKSIAPSYMVIAALKALSDQQKGAAVPAPQGTVKDQVIAQATPPTQAGLGAMMPQQAPQMPVKGFSSGGVVQEGMIDPTDPIYRILGAKKLAQAQTEAAADWLRPYEEAARRNQMTHTRSASSGIATAPTAPTATKNPNYGNEGMRVPIKVTDPSVVAAQAAPVLPSSVSGSRSASGSARTSGVGSTGARNPFVEYGKYNVKPKDLADIEGMAAPENTELIKAIQNITPQQAEKMAQIAREREAAGLAAFGSGMVSTKNGRGFGAAFAPAAASSIGAMMEKDKEGRAIEMRYEDIARDLGIKKGTEDYNRYKDKYESKVKEREFDVGRKDKEFEAGFRTTEAKNKEELEKRRLDLLAREIEARLEGVRETAAARQDNKLLAQIEMISRQRTAAVEKARQNVMARYEKNPLYQADPNVQRKAALEANQAADEADRMYLVQLRPFMKQLGIPTE